MSQGDFATKALAWLRIGMYHEMRAIFASLGSEAQSKEAFILKMIYSEAALRMFPTSSNRRNTSPQVIHVIINISRQYVVVSKCIKNILLLLIFTKITHMATNFNTL